MPGTYVVHLVRAVNGPEHLARFLESYARTNRVTGQKLVIILKGFEIHPEQQEPCQQLLAEHPHIPITVPDIGFDIEPYFVVAHALDAEYFCFLNSFSTILDPDWLNKMLPALQMPGVGIVGATSSYLSYQTYYQEHKADFLSKPPYNTLAGRVRFALVQQMYKRWYAPFPNPFLRTNGYLVKRDVFTRLPKPRIRRKTDAYRFESGVQGMTRRIQQMGLRPLVVGKNGAAYEISEWPHSKTFMQANQENLLIADNQTYHYDTSDDAFRYQLAYNSWGKEANPTARGEHSFAMQDSR